LHSPTFDLRGIQFVSPKGDIEPYRNKLSDVGFAKLQEIIAAKAINDVVDYKQT
jgi:hypothetical protein